MGEVLYYEVNVIVISNKTAIFCQRFAQKLNLQKLIKIEDNHVMFYF